VLGVQQESRQAEECPSVLSVRTWSKSGHLISGAYIASAETWKVESLRADLGRVGLLEGGTPRTGAEGCHERREDLGRGR